MGGFVYLWTNRVNGKKYLGSHVGSPDDGYLGSGKVFKQALEKYGIESFDRVILETVDDNSKVKEREQFYLDKFEVAKSRDFYNVSPHAGGGWDRWKNNPHPRGMKGKHHSKEKRLQISETSKKTAKVRSYNQSRPVVQMDLDGNEIRVFDSITDAARAVNGSPSNIKYTCEGKFKTAYKFKWKYPC